MLFPLPEQSPVKLGRFGAGFRQLSSCLALGIRTLGWYLRSCGFPERVTSIIPITAWEHHKDLLKHHQSILRKLKALGMEA